MYKVPVLLCSVCYGFQQQPPVCSIYGGAIVVVFACEGAIVVVFMCEGAIVVIFMCEGAVVVGLQCCSVRFLAVSHHIRMASPALGRYSGCFHS